MFYGDVKNKERKSMYLRELKIRRFRGIKEAKLIFLKGLNVIIGENNSGKTTAIDALRICLGLGYQRREVQVKGEDFFVDSLGERSAKIEFDLCFETEREEERGIFIEMLAIGETGKPELQLHVHFLREEKHGDDRIRVKYWGGENEGQRLHEEVLELLYFVSLGALRNADRDLLPGSSNRLGQLLMKLVSNGEEQKKYANRLNDVIQTDEKWKTLRTDAKKRINEHLDATTMLKEGQRIDIDFVSLEYKKIVEQLKVFLPFIGVVKREELLQELKENNIQDDEWEKYFENPEHSRLKIKEKYVDFLMGVKIKKKTEGIIVRLLKKRYMKFEVSQNGLGYNNLIFISTVLGDIVERKKTEREGYVALLMEEPEAHLHPQLQDTLFNYFGDIGKKNIQVFITSHSPTITSKTDIDSISVMKVGYDKISSTPLRTLSLKPEEKNRLQRFLDVTKCQLFFAKSVILVEGICEAILLPVFAKKMGEKYDLDKNGVEVVSIGGVAFEPFAKLFNSNKKDLRLDVRCVIVTDDDKGRGKNIEEDEISSRAKKAKQLEGGNLIVRFADHTFEYELYQENYEVLKSIYTNKMGHTQTKINSASEFVEKLESNKDKGEFAQVLASYLQNNKEELKNFNIPSYLREAIRWVVDGESEAVNK